MTVVLEDQVKTITAEISEQFGDNRYPSVFAATGIEIEDVVRAVIALYDISNIARLEVPLEALTPEPSHSGPIEGPNYRFGRQLS